MKDFLLNMVKSGCDQSGLGTLKLTVSQEWTDGISWFVKGNGKVFLNGHSQKQVWAFGSHASKIDCI